MESVPGYVSIVFILTTFTAVAFLLRAVLFAGRDTLAANLLFFLLPLWILFQTVLATGGFYQDTTAQPPRLFIFGVLPALLTLSAFLLFFRSGFIEQLPLRLLTLVHLVRIPVELVLLWLFRAGEVPQAMTFEGMNFDILSGGLALAAYFLAFRGDSVNRGMLIGFNILGLILLVNIVSIAVMSLPSPLQQMAFDQPNRAVLFFPYIWLPTIVVPIVLFSHLASLWKLAKGKTV